jgi:hypothetical protein
VRSDIKGMIKTEGVKNKVLRRLSGLKRDEVTRGWRNVHNEKLHNLCSSLSIIRMIKSRRIWSGHVV